jgi:hypothetical protein
MAALLAVGLALGGCAHPHRGSKSTTPAHCMEVWALSAEGASALRESGAPAFIPGEAGGVRYHLHPGRGARVQVLDALDVDAYGLRPAPMFRIAETPVPGGVEKDLPAIGPRTLSLEEREGRLGGRELALVLQAEPSPLTLWRGSASPGPGRASWFVAGTDLFVELRGEHGGVGCRVAMVDLRRAAATALDAQGVALLREGRLAEARSALEQAVEVAPEDATAAYNLACTLSLEGALPEALHWLERALWLDETGRLRLWARRDPDLEPLRGDAAFSALVR